MSAPVRSEGPGRADGAAAGAATQVLAIPRARLGEDWRGALARTRAYLEALEVPEPAREPLARRALERAATAPWPEGTDAVAASLAEARALFVETRPRPGPEAPDPDAFAAARLARHGAGGGAGWSMRPGDPAEGPGTLAATPPLLRGPMTAERPHAGRRTRLRRARRAGFAWLGRARRRRVLLIVLVAIPSLVASAFMAQVFPDPGRSVLETALVLAFGALFGWISIGFWTAVLGFWTLVRRDPFRIARSPARPASALDPGARAALVMPVCEEPVDRVFAGLEAMRASLERAGALERFDFFVLSDSADPDAYVAEEEAFGAWRRAFGAGARLYYRRRRVRRKRKSGNVADFCRRFGRRYRYMVLADADSVMSGATLVRLLDLMEAHPDTALVQTLPRAVNRRSLFGRVQQLASHVYAPVFAAGMHYWQLGDAPYWGHNAIVRVEPFMRHCGLPRLPGRPPWGGEILSHDFVEAALLGRAGWALWLAYDLEGSYEEVPSSLLEEMRRDRRWCQGNLQHLRLVLAEGLHAAHRALFLNGVLSYVSALLWLVFLALGTTQAVLDAVQEPDYFAGGPSLFPAWPVWRPDWALALVAVTGVVLFLPKILGIVWVLLQPERARPYGGVLRLAVGVVLEILLSALLAPIRMLFHARFVLWNLAGRTVPWRSQDRGDAETSWGEALRRHGLDTLLGSLWGLGVWATNPDYFWWLTPIVAALVLAVPVSVLTSRVRAGDRAARLGLFRTPAETRRPPELRDLDAALARRAAEDAPHPGEEDGFVRAVVDPWTNALHGALARGARRTATTAADRAARREGLVARALAEGPAALGPEARARLLAAPEALAALHEAVWADPRERERRWGRLADVPSVATD